MKSYLKAFSIVALSFVLMGQTRFPPQGGGVTVAGNNTWTGTQTFGDEAFLVCDDGDDTKCVELEASGITTETTRTLTIQDASYTLAGINTTQTFTQPQTINTTLTLSSLSQVIQFDNRPFWIGSTNTTDSKFYNDTTQTS